MPFSPVIPLTLLFVGVCIACDVRTMRIPNKVTGPAIVAGLTVNGLLAGWHGVALGLTGFGLAVAILIGPFALGGIGAGDVKMMGAVGAFVGPDLVLASLIAGMILGGVLAAYHLARRSRLREKLASTARMVVNAVLSRSLDPLRAPSASPSAVALPYSVPLGVGTLAAIALSVVGR